MPQVITAEHHRVLGILAGCPDGATAYCLTHHNEVALRTINELVQHKLADARYQQVATHNAEGTPITVARLKITTAGRRALVGSY
jgi:hypothetical protein